MPTTASRPTRRAVLGLLAATPLGLGLVALPARAELDLTLPPRPGGRRGAGGSDPDAAPDLVPQGRPQPRPGRAEIDHLPGGGARVRQDGLSLERRPPRPWMGEEGDSFGIQLELR